MSAKRSLWTAICITTCTASSLSMNAQAAEIDHSQHKGMDHSAMNHAASGKHDHSSRADSHGPINVMGDHTHNQGEWMFSYRYMKMSMKDNYDGSKKISDEDVHQQGFMVAPKSMDMDMHMLGAMYAPSDDLTLGFMLPYIENSMDLQMKMTTMPNGMPMAMPMYSTFKTESKGLGDLKATALYNLLSNHTTRLHLNMGLSLPTGSIDQKDETPMSNGQEVILPYPMQLGSGTYDLLPGITYNGTADAYSYGAQLSAVIRTGQNSNDYRLGNRYKAQTWAAMPVTDFMSASLRGSYEQWGNIIGKNDDLNPMMIPTARTDLRGGKKYAAAIGVNFLLPAGNRLALEWEQPIQQDLEGPQLASEPMLTLGWQKVL